MVPANHPNTLKLNFLIFRTNELELDFFKPSILKFVILTTNNNRYSFLSLI